MTNPTTPRHSTMPASWRVGWPRPIGPRVEDPIRIRQFTELLSRLSWTPSESRSSLNVIFDALSELAHAEIRYYYVRRSGSRRLSRWCRFLAWALGSIGLLIPLVGPVWPTAPQNLLSWGYIAFALAGSVLVADTVFAGTQAHQRYVRTQLGVEQIYTLFSLEWHALLVVFDAAPTPENAAALLRHAIAYCKSFHGSLQNETAEWQVAMNESLEKLKGQASPREQLNTGK